MLGRLVNQSISHHGYNHVWGNLLPFLQEQDITLMNLETTLTKSKVKVPKVFNFKASPDKVHCLTNANVTIVNIANNHILDFEKEGLLETIQVLDDAGIAHVGAGSNCELARKSVILERKH